MNLKLLKPNSFAFFPKLSITTEQNDETLDRETPVMPPRVTYIDMESTSSMIPNTECDYENEKLAHMRIHEAGCTPEKVGQQRALGRSKDHA
jgi:hypothetical protein